MYDDAVDSAVAANRRFRPVQIGAGVVTRPATAATPTAHSLLRHLHAHGVHGVPEPLGVADGRERLAFLPGASGGDGWYHQHTDQGLASAARLLRRLHDASADWTPPADTVWAAPPVVGPDAVFCHGDPGPWNFVWSDQEAVGLVDWDYLHPAPRLDDVAYALRWFAPLRSDALALGWQHFRAVPDRRHRVQVFLEAYGPLPVFDVTEARFRRPSLAASPCSTTEPLQVDVRSRG